MTKEVREQWGAWRLVLSECGFDYNTVFHQMTPEEIERANIALDMKIKEMKRQTGGD